MSSSTVWVREQVQGEQWLKSGSPDRKMETDRQTEVGEGGRKRERKVRGFLALRPSLQRKL